MKEIRAFRGLNGQIYEDSEKAKEADGKWLDAKLQEELNKLFATVRLDDRIRALVEKRKEVIELFGMYDEMRHEAMDSQ